ncbi:DUF4259 domain-containing protein [Paenibacillus sp. GSMTC-2017]|uniref:DUF4259 domain-containing protein n=1 Tax=Paenibacillus sp. GSMTC-2017 TaxID=2794350 RepID=UPI0018D8966B|nr:DUF4259 domain-containing protein [Paenibacillus sp. GSMTC-2017]
MGAWGHGNLENDTVLDWVVDLLEAQDLELISEAIEMVHDGKYIDADTASIALGAIDILAAMHNKPGQEGYEEDLEEWISQHKGQGTELLLPAKKALGKILIDSELKELWEETDSFDEWVLTINELEGRLL